MSAFLIDWLNLLIRWAHIIVGIGWIGASFYFVALDFSLRKKPSEDEEDKGVLGESWLVHGGGFYQVKKFSVAPPSLPDRLIWYKWDAYLTWLTGFALLAVQYYLSADVYLIDASKADITETMAIAMSIGALLAGWIVYDLTCRALEEKSQLLTAGIVFVMIVFAAWGFSQVFSNRGAMIHVGAFVGTIMAANVFAIIIPNQKKIVASLLAGEAPDPKLGKMGKQRSLHNNYLTLPVLLMMVSHHYPLLGRHPQSWLVIALIIILGAAVRHFINRHEAGDPFKKIAWTLPVAIVALLAALFFTAPPGAARPPGEQTEPTVTDAEAMDIVSTHCGACHAPLQGFEEYFVAPKDVRLQTLEDMQKFRRLIEEQTVFSQAMPMGNASEMTDQERAMLGQWITQQDRND